MLSKKMIPSISKETTVGEYINNNTMYIKSEIDYKKYDPENYKLKFIKLIDKSIKRLTDAIEI